MRRRQMIGVLLAAGVAGTSSCVPWRRAPNQPRTVVTVENQYFLDARVYLRSETRRVRIGIASGLGKTRLIIPADLIVMGGSSLQFEADPIGGSARPVSEAILAYPGDELYVQIASTGMWVAVSK